jgi:hypothetical protein
MGYLLTGIANVRAASPSSRVQEDDADFAPEARAWVESGTRNLWRSRECRIID